MSTEEVWARPSFSCQPDQKLFGFSRARLHHIHQTRNIHPGCVTWKKTFSFSPIKKKKKKKKPSNAGNNSCVCLAGCLKVRFSNLWGDKNWNKVITGGNIWPDLNGSTTIRTFAVHQLTCRLVSWMGLLFNTNRKNHQRSFNPLSPFWLQGEGKTHFFSKCHQTQKWH